MSGKNSSARRPVRNRATDQKTILPRDSLMLRASPMTSSSCVVLSSSVEKRHERRIASYDATSYADCVVLTTAMSERLQPFQRRLLVAPLWSLLGKAVGESRAARRLLRRR